MKESHYNMYMKNLETLGTQLWGTIVQQQASRQKMNLKGWSGKCVQMYRAQFLYLPGAPNTLNLPCISYLWYQVSSLVKARKKSTKMFLTTAKSSVISVQFSLVGKNIQTGPILSEINA